MAKKKDFRKKVFLMIWLLISICLIIFHEMLLAKAERDIKALVKSYNSSYWGEVRYSYTFLSSQHIVTICFGVPVGDSYQHHNWHLFPWGKMDKNILHTEKGVLALELGFFSFLFFIFLGFLIFKSKKLSSN